jgi:adenosine kinase
VVSESKKGHILKMEGILFGMGNPLLDISANVPPSYLDQYSLKPNDAILAEDKHLPIYNELIANYQPVQYIAGGATQNSIRVAQWMLQAKHATGYIGCIGDDAFGKQLRQQAEGDGVRVQYLVDPQQATGTCACLITEKVRSLVANLAAANHYKRDHLMKPENWSLVDQARYAYIGGFFLTVSPDSILEVGKHCSETNKYFMMNLSAPFICTFFKDPLMEAMPYIDILFGNEAEADALSKSLNLGTTDMKEIAKKVTTLPKVNQSRPRIVIFTQGPDPILLCKDGVTVTEHPILPIKEEDIVDTNGAGDAWVGGFLSQLVQGKPVEECIRGGNYAANIIIKRSGCTYPEKPDFI